jgi:hypothetical protein
VLLGLNLAMKSHLAVNLLPDCCLLMHLLELLQFNMLVCHFNCNRYVGTDLAIVPAGDWRLHPQVYPVTTCNQLMFASASNCFALGLHGLRC